MEIKAKVKSITDWLVSKWQAMLAYLWYDYLLTLWLNLNRIRAFWIFVKKYFGLLRRVLLVLVGLGVGLVINKYGSPDFTQEVLSNYLVAAGAMAGGTIAIVFTISIFLLQNAADLYSSQYFEVYIHDWKEKFVYFLVILITLGFFATGLYIGGFAEIPHNAIHIITPVSLVLLGYVFALIDWQYKNVRQKINPSTAIAFLESEGLRFLRKLQSDAKRIAAIMHAKDKTVSQEVALAAAYNKFLAPFVSDLDRQLENLIEISTRLSDRQEIKTTKRGLAAFHNVLLAFLEARKTSSLALSSTIAFLAVESDSQSFLSRNFERLNKAGEKFMAENKTENAAYIVDIYNSLATKSGEISFIGRQRENPILDNLLGYFEFYIESAKRAKDIEVVYQGARVLGNIVALSARSGLAATLHGLQNKIYKVGVFGLTEKQTPILDRVISIYLGSLRVLFFSNQVIREHYIRSILDNIATLSNYTFVAIKSGFLPDDFTNRVSTSKGYDELYGIIAEIVNHYEGLEDGREKERYLNDLVELFRELNMSLRKLSEEVKDADSTLIDSIGRLLFNVNNLMVQMAEHDSFKKAKGELESRLGWNIHLPYWFTRHTVSFDAGSNPFNTLTDSISKTAIVVATTLKNKKLLIDAINSLYSITEQALEKTSGKYGYDEPRILEKACYIGILALKYGWYDVFVEVGLKIYDFEPKYFQKYFTNLPEGVDPENHNVIGLPRKNQLEVELMRWRADFDHETLNGLLRIRDDAEAMMYELIDKEDIDWFMFEVWHSFPADSDIREQVQERFHKRVLIRKMGGLLKTRISMLTDAMLR